MMEKPFQINSVTVPLMGDVYLNDRIDVPGWIVDNDPGLANFIDRIVASGADSVKLGVHSVMNRATDNLFDAELTRSYNPSDEDIIRFAKALAERGLSLELQSLVIIANREDSSNIITNRINPTDSEAWMNSYSDQMLKWARLAETINADRFSLFSDLEQHMTWKPELTDRWASLANDVRQVFSGHLTTTAYNDAAFQDWGNIFYLTPNEIWKSLDSLGLSPFPDYLTETNSPTIQQLINGWYENSIGTKTVDFFKSLSEEIGRPVYFSDRTFHSFDGSNINHGQIFQSNIPLNPDPQEQADLFESFLRAFSLEQGDWLLGVSFNSITRVNDYSIDSPNRYIKSAVGEDWEGKPAGDVLNAWFTGLKQSEGRLFSGDTETDKNDRIVGGYHHDSLLGGLGDDYLDGGAGIDMAIYSGSKVDYLITASESTSTVTDLITARDGSDTLIQVERVQFDDTSVALDTDGVAGQAYRIYKAAFDRAPDLAGLGYWIDAMDNGAELASVAGGFIGSNEFQSRYGSTSDTDFIRLLYENVLDRQPDAAGYAYWQDAMSRGLSREGLLINFSESTENKANVADLIANGIEYTSFIS